MPPDEFDFETILQVLSKLKVISISLLVPLKPHEQPWIQSGRGSIGLQRVAFLIPFGMEYTRLLGV